MIGAATVNTLQEMGLIVRNIQDSVALCPPLIITTDEIHEMFDIFEKGLEPDGSLGPQGKREGMMIGSEEELRAKFGEVSHLASAKSRPALDKYSRQFIGLSPFLVISTADATGRADLSPRGDPPGFVQVIDDNTILIPDRPGNNRLDTMANIVANPNVGLPVLRPRLRGHAAPQRQGPHHRRCRPARRLQRSTASRPKVGILVTVEEVFLHCAKALKRSKLWDPDYRQDRAQMPSIARIILEQTCTPVAEPEAAEDRCRGGRGIPNRPLLTRKSAGA